MIKDIVEKQRVFYLSGATRSYGFRMEALTKLKQTMLRNETLLIEALKADLNKSESESFLCEIGMVLDELKYHQKHLKTWMKERRIRPSMAQLPGKCFISPEPYGVTLIMAPWNYPVNLCFVPLIGAISAGNTAVLKPSAYAGATSSAIAKVIGEAFPPEYITVVEGGRQENAALLEEQFDYIFFTGSPEVGRIVMAAAAKHLTPVTLELGGKSPVIVDETANIRLAAKRIAFGKVINAGQTCIEPDYLLIHEQVKDSFVKEFAKALDDFFPDGNMDQMCTVITQKHYERLKGLMAEDKILLGGRYDDARRFIEPTLVEGITLDSPLMQEEIFGPLLPILTFKELEECINVIRSLPRPLAFYLFSENPKTQRLFLEKISFGGGCINDTILHFPNPRLPFGGIGNSGMGSYHGKYTFDTFTHYRSVFKQSTRMDIALRYMPYTKEKLKLIRKVLG
ncbi:MAG: aldehyde dehydrogenase [Peptococcaceae bacterium]|nr:aldehyde dehydrogenase [Peptococcaceae bacterium]